LAAGQGDEDGVLADVEHGSVDRLGLEAKTYDKIIERLDRRGLFRQATLIVG
jgi:hypothetical protein